MLHGRAEDDKEAYLGTMHTTFLLSREFFRKETLQPKNLILQSGSRSLELNGESFMEFSEVRRDPYSLQEPQSLRDPHLRKN